MPVVQMITSDRVGGGTLPVEVVGPMTAQSLTGAAAKKFKAVNKQSRVYHGLTGAELTGELSLQELQGAFVVFSGKAGWKGAARLGVATDSGQATASGEEAQDAAAAPPASCEDTSTRSASALLEAARSDRAQGVVLCWKETQDNGYLSNWARSPFVIDGVSYNCAEQWIMACKARACGDDAVLAQIMSSQSPRKQKGLGRSLDPKAVQRSWRLQDKMAAQLAGARAKFQQNEALVLKLLRTGQKAIAEASPSDRVFGIGLAPSDPLAQDPSSWKGTNLLGKALMSVRDELRQHILQSHGEGQSHSLRAAEEAGLGPTAARSALRARARRACEAARRTARASPGRRATALTEVDPQSAEEMESVISESEPESEASSHEEPDTG